MHSRERMRPGPVAPGYPAGGGPNSPYNRSHAQGYSGYSRSNSKHFDSPSRKYEILLEAGRLATEYLVSTGVLPPNSTQRNFTSGNLQDFKGPNGTFQDYRGSVNQNPAYNDPRGPPDRKRRFDDDYDRWRPRKDGRGKKKSGYYKRGYSDWDRNRGRNSGRGYSDDEEEEEEYGGPSYHRERRSMNFDEVGSSVSGIAGESGSAPVKRETQRESGSDLEDTGSKASSCSIKKDTQPEPGEVSNVEHGEISNGDKEDAGTEAGSGDKVINMPERDLDVRDSENGENDHKNLLEYCDYAKAPTKPRSILPQNRGQLVDPVANEGIAENTSNNAVECLSSQTVENKDNIDVEMFVPAPAVAPVEKAKEEVNSYAQPIILEEEQEVKNESVTKKDEVVEATDEVKTGAVIVSDSEPRPEVTTQEVQKVEKGMECGLFKTLDLNISNNMEITEIPDDQILSSDSNKENKVNFGASSAAVEVNGDENSYQYKGNQQNDTVHIIQIDDSPVGEMVVEMVPSDQAQPKENREQSYPNTENMLANLGNVDVMPSMQDDFNFTLSDYVGGDICYQMQTDLHPSGISGVDDPIYGSLGDIGFEVWGQPNQEDYERFF